MTSPITLIDTQQSNISSVRNMLKRLGVAATIAQSPADLAQATKIILPGVGHFGAVMQWLCDSGYRAALDDAVLTRKTPILGICLGMQLMTKGSAEAPAIEGLGWVDADVREFQFNDRPVPHMGWNDVTFRAGSGFDALYATDGEPPRFYFVHSYYVACAQESDVLGTTHYGHDFVSAFRYKHIMGMQFHPEKSHAFGMKALKYFAEMPHG